MSVEEVENPIMWRIPEWFPELSDEVVAKLKIYHTELIHFNGKMNLISPRTESNADLVHFSDSILGGRIVLEATGNKTIFDIGSGNGLPGLVMAIMAPERKFYLLDKDARKTEFMKHCVKRLRLDNVETVHLRFEEMPPDSIECAVSRGFASISKSLLLSRKICKLGAEYFHLKSDNWTREVAEIPTQLCRYWAPMHVKDYQLPDDGARLSIVVTKKIG